MVSGSDGEPYIPGATFCQPDLARLLRTLAKKGVEEFYQERLRAEGGTVDPDRDQPQAPSERSLF